ncbi:MAG: TlpA family protein disulfide reductase [Actinobacteria bacterium]|nr:TlpA family protein disulfide reductase [Actinomycetota bacterium]
MRRRTFVPVIVALALVASACASDGGAATPASADALPSASLARLDGEGEVDPADLRGQPLVVNFWATWCVYCIEEMPAFEQVHQALGDQVQFLGVDREDSLEKARALEEETGVTYPSVVDADGSYFRAAGGRGMPTTLFVDADGIIVYRQAGPLTAEQLETLIRDELLS